MNKLCKSLYYLYLDLQPFFAMHKLKAGLSETGLCAALAENALIIPQWIGKWTDLPIVTLSS